MTPLFPRCGERPERVAGFCSCPFLRILPLHALPGSGLYDRTEVHVPVPAGTLIYRNHAYPGEIMLNEYQHPCLHRMCMLKHTDVCTTTFLGDSDAVMEGELPIARTPGISHVSSTLVPIRQDWTLRTRTVSFGAAVGLWKKGGGPRGKHAMVWDGAVMIVRNRIVRACGGLVGGRGV
ncbi:hypothetical protein EX30DRAFT_62967 [Ascodesmis nigricans]|uniref:Uncharacterized protein n=1 Tax=Ascodesmis nigricans TaxID=341454 RepID=A0A4S2MUD9_9PEZI|nr:hypothetical protein EX30DRAFT_62967 [Ascodesmis nigricans]